jgi:hypothetical protein
VKNHQPSPEFTQSPVQYGDCKIMIDSSFVLDLLPINTPKTFNISGKTSINFQFKPLLVSKSLTLELNNCQGGKPDIIMTWHVKINLKLLVFKIVKIIGSKVKVKVKIKCSSNTTTKVVFWWTYKLEFIDWLFNWSIDIDWLH